MPGSLCTTYIDIRIYKTEVSNDEETALVIVFTLGKQLLGINIVLHSNTDN
mgnify:CR=1 FL=1